MEVIYTGIRQTPEMIAQSALQEDVDVVGLSILSGAHNELFPHIMEQLKKRKMDRVLVIAGGIIPEEDHPALNKIGIKGIFGPGTPTKDIAEFIRKAVGEKKAA
jgi:methylmalonyl-CoA mutase C-terminal domain/subunit